MRQVEFSHSDEIIAYVSSYLSRTFPNTSLSPQARSLLAQDLVSIWAKPAETVQPGRSRPAHIATLKWVIRDDDLKLLDSVLDGLRASAGAGFFVLAGVTVTGTTVGAIGILAGLLKLAYNAVSKGAVLSSRDYSTIATLFGQPHGLTDQEILDRLLSTEAGWTIEKVRDSLTMLSEVPSRGGKIAMVWKSADDRWRTTGI